MDEGNDNTRPCEPWSIQSVIAMRWHETETETETGLQEGASKGLACDEDHSHCCGRPGPARPNLAQTNLSICHQVPNLDGGAFLLACFCRMDGSTALRVAAAAVVFAGAGGSISFCNEVRWMRRASMRSRSSSARLSVTSRADCNSLRICSIASILLAPLEE